mmetsp:Transcript_1253/g.2758  ORF Transcript_1253/g.2758 Transcript_1253/m.2758 type:complete len:296 (-) Transcript_1253:8-895(-)
MKDPLRILVTNGTIRIILVVVVLLNVLQNARLTKIMLTRGHNRIDKGLSTQETRKGEMVILRDGRGVGCRFSRFRLATTIHKLGQLRFFVLFLLCLLLFPLLFQLPSRHGITPIVQVYTGITIPTKSRIFVILANVRLVIKTRRDTNVLTGLDGTGMEFVPRGVSINPIGSATTGSFLLLLLLDFLLGGQMQGSPRGQIRVGQQRGCGGSSGGNGRSTGIFGSRCGCRCRSRVRTRLESFAGFGNQIQGAFFFLGVAVAGVARVVVAVILLVTLSAQTFLLALFLVEFGFAKHAF